MKSCARTLEWMQDYLDGSLPLADRQALSHHLAQCPQCQATWEALLEVEEVLAAPPLMATPPGFKARTMARLRAQRVVPVATSRPPMALRAALVTGVTIVLFLWWGALAAGSLPFLSAGQWSALWTGISILGSAVSSAGRALLDILEALAPVCRSAALGAGGMLLLSLVVGLVTGVRRISIKA